MMLLASLENDNHIEMRHWARAQMITERWRAGLHNLYDQINGDEGSVSRQIEENILKYIADNGPSTARDVYRSTRKLDSAQANIILEGMVQNGLLQREETGKTVKYALAG